MLIKPKQKIKRLWITPWVNTKWSGFQSPDTSVYIYVCVYTHTHTHTHTHTYIYIYIYIYIYARHCYLMNEKYLLRKGNRLSRWRALSSGKWHHPAWYQRFRAIFLPDCTAIHAIHLHVTSRCMIRHHDDTQSAGRSTIKWEGMGGGPVKYIRRCPVAPIYEKTANGPELTTKRTKQGSSSVNRRCVPQQTHPVCQDTMTLTAPTDISLNRN
jgi:hypothetical protein